ncbi:hypothetical protein CAOG_009845 [Capsaspora owczarzaki ATCC 30864]|uniref:Uncharacterized protein n=1 Tax=Capsaspora owczarzaki (strain ATCC 30864) TaxID=595528 RepID=A0A0D2WT59_CAPO3|nr:hypothetical protein CAOG_009845 [Capsaspora owczarzaki ATCC 30864]
MNINPEEAEAKKRGRRNPGSLDRQIDKSTRAEMLLFRGRDSRAFFFHSFFFAVQSGGFRPVKLATLEQKDRPEKHAEERWSPPDRSGKKKRSPQWHLGEVFKKSARCQG